MTLVTNDPLTQLAFSIYENKGIFAVLIGSGMSRSAQIPTGWEITLDLIRRVALTQGVEDQADWASWYREKTGKEPSYSTLLEELASSPEERRSILHSYIEPSNEDIEEGRKVPTAAHRAIAHLVRDGYIRVIVTTNFDRLMENALRELGIESTIVASADALMGAEPLTHSRCYILKLHGDYKDARILNTDVELGAYPEQYDRLLDRILDEHGLIVCGWSGEWDHALRAAFLRAPNRRYSMFWASRGTLGNGAQEIVQHRKARVIPITDADKFFSSVHQRVQTLEQSYRPNPVGTALMVASAKRLLVKPEYRIQLDELFAHEIERVLSGLDNHDLSRTDGGDVDDFRLRVKKLESLSESLSCMVGVLGRWGTGNELRLVLDVIRSLQVGADKVRGDVVKTIYVRSFPAVLVFTAYAIGLTQAERWSELHTLFTAISRRENQDPQRMIDVYFLETWRGTDQGAWKSIEGFDRHKTPFSDYLLDLFSRWGKRFLGLTAQFEMTFERFELLGALAFLESETNEEVLSHLEANPAGHNYMWMPLGRIGWNNSDRTKLVEEMQQPSIKGLLLKSGFAKGDAMFFELFIKNLAHAARRMRFMW